MFDWYHGLDRDGRRTFWACFSGYALDAMDVQIYSFVVPVLIGLWAMSNTQAGLLATVTLILSAAGGWIAGLLADRIGRVSTLQITVAWFAVFTLPLRFHQQFRTAAGDPRAARSGLRRRVGRRIGSDGGGHRRPPPRQGGRRRAKLLVRRLGHRRAGRDSVLVAAAQGIRLEGAVLPRSAPRLQHFHHPPSGSRAGRLYKSPGPCSLAGDLLATFHQHHGARLSAGFGRAGRVLRHHHLAADLPAHGTASLGPWHRKLSRRHHRRLVLRLHHQRVSQRHPWTAQDVPDLRH